MKRPAIAGLWVGSIAATWLIVRGVTTEESIVVAPKPVAREGAVRVTQLPALPTRDVPTDVIREIIEDDTAFRDVLATLERDLADGRWGIEDRDRLNRGVRNVTAAQAGELYEVLLPKLNAGTIHSDIDGPPL